MNIHEAATSGKPFRHKDMIGAWAIVDGMMVHRDNVRDFEEMDWIKENCLPIAHKPNDGLYWMCVSDLTRTDWELC